MFSLSCFFLLLVHIPTFNAQNAIRTNKIHGNSTIGYYFIEVYIGSNLQPQTLIVDTGSYNIIIPCVGCQTCGTHTFPYFDPVTSTSFNLLQADQKYYDWQCKTPQSNNTCGFYEGYVEGSMYRGYLALDSLLFKEELHNNSTSKKRAIIGCATIETNEFFNQKVNGIMGLAPEKQGQIQPPTIIDIELLENRIQSNTFSICIGRNGGYLSFGGPTDFTHLSGSPILLDSSNLPWTEFYYVNLDGLAVY